MGNELAVRENGAAIPWQVMKEQAAMLVKTGFLPEAIKTPEQAVAIMLTGQELGIPPMQALRGVHVIKGTPSVKPELMLALCVQRIKGFKYSFGKSDTNSATFTVSRPEMAEPYVSVFTMADAKAAGLTSNPSWQKYPGNMLRWRAVANALHIVAPDVLVGVYTPDEMGAVVDADGEVIDTPAPPRREVVDATTGECTDAEVVDEPPVLANKKQLQRLGILCAEKLSPQQRMDVHRGISRMLKLETPITSRTELTSEQIERAIAIFEKRPDYVPPQEDVEAAEAGIDPDLFDRS